VPSVAEGVVHVKLGDVPALAVGGVLFTPTNTLEVAVHPLLPVTVTVYVVEVVALVVGFEILVELKAVTGDHEYVLPATLLVPSVPEGVVQVKLGEVPALAVGGVLFTPTITLDVAVHPLLPVTVTVYVVEVVALVVGFEIVVELKAVTGDHE
jgi:hypothetical protein